MKKLMMTTVAALGFAALAQADVLNSTGFERYGENEFKVNTSDEGSPDSGTQYWTGTGDFSQTVLKTYAEAGIAAPAIVPDAFTNAANTTFLSVDTGNDVMYRKAGADAGSVDLTQGAVFFDANVKFTASETDVEVSDSAGDKLLVWLKSNEDSQTTNLVVTAGLYNELTGNYDPTNFTVDGIYAADTWYRLTVKAAVDDNDRTYFNVYIDGDPVVATDKTTDFYSLVQTGAYKYVIAEAGFQGTGALDNVVWTKTDPFPPEATYTLTLEGAGDFDSVSVAGTSRDLAQDVSAQIGVSATEVTVELTTGTNGTVTPTTEAEGVELGEVTKVVTKETDPEDPEGESWDVFTFTFTVTIAEPAVGAEYTIALAFETSGGEEVPETAEPGTPAVVEAETQEQAVAKVNITVPAAVAEAVGEDTATYVARFTKTATYNAETKKWVVTVVLTEAAVTELKADADAGVADLLDVVTGDAESATATVPAGFYWALSAGTSLEGMANGAGQISDGKGVSLNVDKSGDAGFYQLIISPEPIPATAE